MTAFIWGESTDVEEFPEMFVVERPAWMRDAACRGKSELFFIDRGMTSQPAKALCAECSVAEQCLAWATSNAEKHGIWAGLNAQALRRRRRAA